MWHDLVTANGGHGENGGGGGAGGSILIATLNLEGRGYFNATVLFPLS